MSRRDWGDIVFAVLLLAVLGLMVRPDSLAPSLISQMGSAMSALVGFVADPQNAYQNTPVGPPVESAPEGA